MIQFSYNYLSSHLVGGNQPPFPLLYCCVMLFVPEGGCAELLLCPRCPLSYHLCFGKLFCFLCPVPPCPLCGPRSAHGLLFIAEKPHNETSLRNHTDMYSGESMLASGGLPGLTPFCLTRLISHANRASAPRLRPPIPLCPPVPLRGLWP